MFGTSNEVSIPKLPMVLLAAVVLAVPVHAADRGKKGGGLGVGVGVSIGGVKAGVGANVGGSRGLASAGVGASLGGKNGVNAGVGATVGGSKGVANAGVGASVGGRNGVNAGVGATVGGSRGLANANVGGFRGLLDANARATVGGSSGLGVGVGANVGGGGLIDADVDVSLGGDDDGLTPTTPVDRGKPGDGRPTPGTDRDRAIVADFAQLSPSDRQQMIKRCRGVNSGGYDAALVKLCRLLVTASR